MRLRDGWFVDLWDWSGLVWSGVLLHTHVHFGVLAWAQCDKRGCDVLFYLLLDLLDKMGRRDLSQV